MLEWAAAGPTGAAVNGSGSMTGDMGAGPCQLAPTAPAAAPAPACGSVKRRLCWDTWGSQEEEPEEPYRCSGAKGAGCGASDGLPGLLAQSPPLQDPRAQQHGAHLLQSPVLNRAVFSSGKRKARVLFSPASRPAERQAEEQDRGTPAAGGAAPVASPAPQQQQEQERELPSPTPQPQLLAGSGAQQQQQQHQHDGVPAPPQPATLATQPSRQLSVAASSSYASLELLVAGADMQQLLTATTASAQPPLVAPAAAAAAAAGADSPATPGAPGASRLPQAPHKDCCARESAAPRQHPARRPGVARALPGLAPSTADDLLQLRSWLSALEAC